LDTVSHKEKEVQQKQNYAISASVVLYNTSVEETLSIINSFAAVPADTKLFLIDNSPEESTAYHRCDKLEYIHTKANIGYGAGHNIAIRKSISAGYQYHFIFNPDIVFTPDVITSICSFMNNNNNVGLVMPKVLYENGDIQYICKLLPTPSDFFVKRFLPRLYSRRQRDRFEMRKSGYNKIMEVPFLSGCFMALRKEAIEQCGMFDERYFMYAEDIDLTRRIHQKFRTVFYPEVSIVHGYEAASYKSLKMFLILFINIGRYFNKWGWILDKDRKKINDNVLASLEK
jgi:GT2 family glycosyltransferase